MKNPRYTWYGLMVFFALFVKEIGGAQALDSMTTDTDSISVGIFETLVIVGKPAEESVSFEKFNVVSENIAVIPRIENYLNYAPGIQMQTGALNTNRINIRGIGSRSPFATSKIRAYLDDIPLTDGVGETSLEDINLQTVKDIKVWKGPSASKYGASLGGVIQYTTGIDPGFSTKFISDNSMGSFGLKRTSNTLVLTGKDRHNFFINQEFLKSDGYRENNDYQKGSYGLLYKFIGNKSHLTVFSNYIDLFSEIPSSLNINDYLSNPRSAAPNWQGVNGYEDYYKWRTGISFSTTLSRHSSLTGTLFNYLFDAFEVRPFNVLDDESKLWGTRINLRYQKDRHTFSIGTEVYRENYQWEIFQTIDSDAGDRTAAFKNQREIANIFGVWKFRVSNKLSWNGGLNLNFTSFDLEDTFYGKNENQSRYYPLIISPHLTFHYHPALLHDLTFSVSHGFATPGLDESLDANGVFNQNIKQEKAWNIELGYRTRNVENLMFELSSFLMFVNDIIVNRQDINGNLFGINAGSTRHYGIEGKIRHLVYLGSDFQLSNVVNLNTGRYHFLDFQDNGNDYSGNQLTGVAPHQFSVISNLEFKGWSLTPSIRYHSSIPINDANTTFSDDYLLTNLRIKKVIDSDYYSLGLQLGIENVFNVRYIGMVAVNASGFNNNLPRYYYPGASRNYTLGAVFSFIQ